MTYSCILFVLPNSSNLDEAIQSLLRQEIALEEVIVASHQVVDNQESIRKKFSTSTMNIRFVEQKGGRTDLLLAAIKKASEAYIFFADSETTWSKNHTSVFAKYIEETDGHLLFADVHGVFRSRDKQAIIEAKADEVLAKNSYLHISQCAIRNDQLSLLYHFAADNLAPLEAYIAAAFSINNPADVGVIEGLSEEGVYPHPLQEEGLSRAEYIYAKERFLAGILEKEENPYYRRAHYFNFVRSTLSGTPFLRKFISINTLFLEGDYKRFTDAPIREAVRDLRS